IWAGDIADFRWGGPRRHFSQETNSAWSLALALVAANNHRRGSLTLHRLDGGGDLQLDVNLLTSIFPEALADALERIEDQAVAGASLHEEHATAVAARAS